MRTCAPGKKSSAKGTNIQQENRYSKNKTKYKKGVHYTIFQYENKGLSKIKSKPREIDITLQYLFICMH